LNKQTSKNNESKRKKQKKLSKQNKLNSTNSQSFHESVQADEPKSSVPSTVVSKSPFDAFEENQKTDPKKTSTFETKDQKNESKPDPSIAPTLLDKSETRDLPKDEKILKNEEKGQPKSKKPTENQLRKTLKSYIRQESSQASVASEPAHPHNRLSQTQSRNSLNENTEESKCDQGGSKSDEISQTSSQKEESEGENVDKKEDKSHHQFYSGVNNYQGKQRYQRKDMYKTSSYQNFKKEIREQK
jgi:hypothetical protein